MGARSAQRRERAIDAPRLQAAQTPEQPRVLLVDDSRVARSVVRRMLEISGDFLLAGEVDSAAGALDMLDLHAVDIMILDIEMPGISGLDALPDILARRPDLKILILSSQGQNGGQAAIAALSLGAAAVMPKPGRASFGGAFAAALLTTLRDLAPPAKLPDRRAARPRHSLHSAVGEDASSVGSAVALCGSTGGIPAIKRFLQSLDRACPVPIFITQHLPAAFVPFLADDLGAVAVRPVHVVDTRHAVSPGCIYLASGRADLLIERSGDGIFAMPGPVRSQADHIGSASADHMLVGLAECFGPSLTIMMLSGMGRDGAQGCAYAHAAGATIYVQSRSTAHIWGMAGAVAALGIAHEHLAPETMAARVSAQLA